MMEVIVGLWPFLVAGGGILFGFFRKKQNDDLKKELQIKEVEISLSHRRARVAEALRDAAFENNAKTKEAIKDAVENAKSDRNHFS